MRSIGRHGQPKDLGENATSKDHFYQFLDDPYLEKIVRYSVAYTPLKVDNNFTTNHSEISAFLCLNILMGIHELPQIQMYSDSDEFIGVEGFNKTIPKQRFFSLSKYIHLMDPATEDQADLLRKVRPLINRLEEKFSVAYVPGKTITVDKGLVKAIFQAVHATKTRQIWNKSLASSRCQHLLRSRVSGYLGKNRTNNELFRQKGLGFYVIWTLREPYLDNHRHFFFDNFFCSVDLRQSLESRNTYACRTVRMNRRDFPADLKLMKLVHGEIRRRQCGNLVATMRKDKRIVTAFDEHCSRSQNPSS